MYNFGAPMKIHLAVDDWMLFVENHTFASIFYFVNSICSTKKSQTIELLLDNYR